MWEGFFAELVAPSPKVQVQRVIGLPWLSTLEELICTVRGTRPFVALTVKLIDGSIDVETPSIANTLKMPQLGHTQPLVPVMKYAVVGVPTWNAWVSNEKIPHAGAFPRKVIFVRNTSSSKA